MPCRSVTVDVMNVWDEKLPEFDNAAIDAKYKGVAGSVMNEAETAVWNRIQTLNGSVWRYDHVVPIPPVKLVADNFAKRIIGQYAFSPAGVWFLRNISPRVDPTLIRLTRGRVSSVGPWPRWVVLTHTGAKSGIQRTTPLIYFTDGDRVILIASNYGSTRHPAWYHNVKANPTVTLYAGGFEGRFVGEEVTGAERDRLWSIAKQWLPGYDKYESSAGDRQIPLLAFTPID